LRPSTGRSQDQQGQEARRDTCDKRLFHVN
jgi:hypothetical protein